LRAFADVSLDLAFFSARFSLSELAAVFFDASFFGDLSAMSTPSSGCRIRLPFQ
jgi:hypothetical protein